MKQVRRVRPTSPPPSFKQVECGCGDLVFVPLWHGRVVVPQGWLLSQGRMLTACSEARPGCERRTRLEGLGRSIGALIGGFVEWVTGVPLDPFEAHLASDHGFVEGLDDLQIEHRLAIALAPTLALPTSHPLGDRVDHIGRVTDDVQRFISGRSLLQQIEYGAQLADIVGAVGKSPCPPAPFIDKPGPTCWTRIAQGGAIRRSHDRHAPILSDPMRLSGTLTIGGMMRSMPGMNLTREEAATRSAKLAVDHYLVQLDLTTGTETFSSTTTIDFRCNHEGSATFADLIAERVHQITFNGVDLDPALVYSDARITLADLKAQNSLTVVADCAYSHSGEGLHRFVDPVDERVYTYSQFEVPDARRVYTTFEQPDLKSVFSFEVIAPSHWKVISNAPTPEAEPLADDKARWVFPTTRPMSTYITAIIAGEYHEVLDEYVGTHGTIPLGHYCRQSLVPHLDSDELVKITRQGFGFFEEAFNYPYPFEKYDQLYVPEYNMGAMENAGAVTLRDEYLPRSRQDGAFYEFRTSVILHEMAHMWFGDLVTMKWWDDLWLNESFAEWACYHAAVEATEFTESWTGFTNARKNWALRQDQLPSTHPIAADNYDLHQVEANFDGITYAKGASVLKQLVAWVGIENFLKGLGEYFKAHEYANSEFADLLGALERSSGRELTSWADEWLRTTGVNTMAPEFTLDADGSFKEFVVRQSAAADHPTLRRHRLGIGLYDETDGRIVRRRYLEVDVQGAATAMPELVGEKQPDLLLLNDKDLAYTKIRLDERSLATMINGLGCLDDSLARALCWGAAWDMTRDAQMKAGDFVDLVLANVGLETDAFGLSRLPGYASAAINVYSAPEHRDALRAKWELGIGQLMRQADAGSDHQLTFTRAFAAAARDDSSLDYLTALLDGSQTLDGLVIDTELRWSLVTALARAGRFGEAEIAAEGARDQTITGSEKSAAARAAQPSAQAKAAAWQQAMMDPTTPNETARSIATSFHRAGQEDLLTPYLSKYLGAAVDAWDRLGAHKAAVALEALFPSLLASDTNVATITDWLAATTAPDQVKRYVGEGLDDMKRALAAQAYDARA